MCFKYKLFENLLTLFSSSLFSYAVHYTYIDQRMSRIEYRNFLSLVNHRTVQKDLSKLPNNILDKRILVNFLTIHTKQKRKGEDSCKI